MTTIGYGQYHPTKDITRIFTSFYIIIGLSFVIIIFDEVVKYYIIIALNNIIEYFYPNITLLERSTKKLSLSFISMIVVAMSGVAFYSANEEWTGATAFYWVVTTMSTVGYGDLIPKYESTRVFTIFFVLFCVITYAATLHNLQEFYAIANEVGANNNNNNNGDNSSSYVVDSISQLEMATMLRNNNESNIDDNHNIIKKTYLNKYNNSESALTNISRSISKDMNTLDKVTAVAAVVSNAVSLASTTNNNNSSSTQRSISPKSQKMVNLMKANKYSKVRRYEQVPLDEGSSSGNDSGNDSKGITDQRASEDCVLYLIAVIEKIHKNNPKFNTELQILRDAYTRCIEPVDRVRLPREILLRKLLLGQVPQKINNISNTSESLSEEKLIVSTKLIENPLHIIDEDNSAPDT